MTNPLDKIVENTPEKKAYEMSLGGFKLKLNNTMIAMAIPLLSALGGTMWGAFEFYKDYMDMRAKIQKYIAPDLTAFDKRLAIIEENSQKSVDYTRDIKNDLKQDIRRIEGVVETVERSTKSAQRDTDQDVRAVRTEVEKTKREIQSENAVMKREVQSEVQSAKREVQSEVQSVKREVDNKIRQALDNPLAGK